MKIETYYWARYDGQLSVRRCQFRPEQGRCFHFTWNDGFYRDQALELVNAWNRETVKQGVVQHQYYLDP